MEVKDIHTIRLQSLQRLIQLALQDLGLVSTQLVGVPLGSDFQTSVFVPSLSGPVFLLSSDVDSGGIYFVVATKLKGLSIGNLKGSRRCKRSRRATHPAF
jgi:hypothetical protein